MSHKFSWDWNIHKLFSYLFNYLATYFDARKYDNAIFLEWKQVFIVS